MKDYCPLYSNPWFPRHKALIYYKNRNDCRICSSLKVEYPEYEVFIHVKTESIEREDWDFRETKDIQFYKCNLCQSQFQYVCEFDLHMRNHTSYGKNIAVISIVSSIESTTTSHKRVSEEVFVAIEAELMKVNGISAVLAVYGKERFMSFTSAVELDEDVTFVASLILVEGVDIRS